MATSSCVWFQAYAEPLGESLVSEQPYTMSEYLTTGTDETWERWTKRTRPSRRDWLSSTELDAQGRCSVFMVESGDHPLSPDLGLLESVLEPMKHIFIVSYQTSHTLHVVASHWATGPNTTHSDSCTLDFNRRKRSEPVWRSYQTHFNLLQHPSRRGSITHRNTPDPPSDGQTRPLTYLHSVHI